MEKFFNDIVTFIANLDIWLVIVLVALFAVLDLCIIRSMVKGLAKDKPKLKFVHVLLFVIISGMMVLVSIYGF